MGKYVGNLILEDYQEKSFYHALRTKGFVILAGLSGTGKTKIFEELCLDKKTNYKYNLIKAIEKFKEQFKDFFDLLNSNLSSPNYSQYYKQWKSALDNYTNVWTLNDPKGVNIVSLLTDYKYSRDQLSSQNEINILLKLSELANILEINIKSFKLNRIRKDGKYAFSIDNTELPDCPNSAQDDKSEDIENFNNNTVFPKLNEFLTIIQSIKNGTYQTNQNIVDKKVAGIFKIIFNETFISLNDLKIFFTDEEIGNYNAPRK